MITPRFTAACLLAASLLAASCSGGSKSTTAATAQVAAPASGSTTTAGGGSSTCRPAGPGATAPDNVSVPGDISDTIKYPVFTSPDGYSIKYPESWARSEAAGSVTFTDKFNSIRVDLTPAATAPSVASAQSTDVPALASSATCFQAGKVSQATRTAGNAVLITYKADSPRDPVTGKVVLQDVERYEFWKAGKLAVITLSAPQGSDNVDPWRTVTDSFTWAA